METTSVGIVYPADPLGSIPGGIETFIRGVLRWAPEDLRFTVVGVSTDREARPVGRFTEHGLGPRRYTHFPVYFEGDPTRQPRIPATVKFMWGMLPRLSRLRGQFDVLEFHRVEPMILFLGDGTPKTAVLHQNMEVVRDGASDIRWKYLPWLYFRLEARLLSRLSSVFAVRRDAVEGYRKRYPELADRFRFTPTWMDPEVFHPVEPEARARLRLERFGALGFAQGDTVLVTVGRLDRQKDPLLLVAAFAELQRRRGDLRLVFVGDGVLRAEVERAAHRAGVAERVAVTGLLAPAAVAECLNAADLFVLTSAYEGMPMAVLEAMGCGLPVCCTNVGELEQVVHPGENGEIAEERNPAAIARAAERCLERMSSYRGMPALAAARRFVPGAVLQPLYDNYRRLAAGGGGERS